MTSKILTTLIVAALAVSSVGCSNKISKNLQYSAARGVGDLSSTAYLDQTQNPEQSKQQVKQVCDQILNWISTQQNLASDVLAAEIQKRVPTDYQFIANLVVNRFTGNVEHDIKTARNLLVGIKLGADLYELPVKFTQND